MPSSARRSLALALAVPCLFWKRIAAAPLEFLSLDADARPAAMGGSCAALCADAHALAYNPAGLAFLNSRQASFPHAELFQGMRQDYAAVALKGPLAGAVGEKGGAGLLVHTVGLGDIPRTTLSNPRGSGLGNFGVRDWAVAVGVGKRLGREWLGAGLAVKYLREDIDNVSAQAGALDLGLRAEIEPLAGIPAAIGMSLQNLGTKPRYQAGREELPLNLKVGSAWRLLEGAVLALDLNIPQDGGPTLHVGAEYGALKPLAVRLGYNGRNETDSGVTAGWGLSWPRFGGDYAFAPFGDLGAAHRMSVSYRW